MDSIASILQELQGYYGTKLNETQAQVYVRNLSDIDITSLRQGVDHLIKNGHPFFPKVAELRQVAKQHPPLPQGTVANADYWSAMSTYNDVLAGRQPASALEAYRKFYPESEDGTPSD